jgi:hypothetical protein
VSEALPPKDGHRHASVTPIRRAQIRKKNREEVERARDTIAFAYQAMANARQLIKRGRRDLPVQSSPARAQVRAGPEARGHYPDAAQPHYPSCSLRSAEAYGKGGQGKKGVARVTEALAFMYDTEWRHSAAKVYRVREPLTLQAEDPR